MSTIKATVSHDDYNKIDRRRTFEIVESLAGDDGYYNDEKVLAIKPVTLDIEERGMRVRGYSFYCITTEAQRIFDDDEYEQNEYYVACSKGGE